MVCLHKWERRDAFFSFSPSLFSEMVWPDYLRERERGGDGGREEYWIFFHFSSTSRKMRCGQVKQVSCAYMNKSLSSSYNKGDMSRCEYQFAYDSPLPTMYMCISLIFYSPSPSLFSFVLPSTLMKQEGPINSSLFIVVAAGDDSCDFFFSLSLLCLCCAVHRNGNRGRAGEGILSEAESNSGAECHLRCPVVRKRHTLI